MKKFNLLAIIAIAVALVLVVGATAANADPVQLTYNGAAGYSTQGEYTFPYFLTVTTNGSPASLDMMCLSLDRNISQGQTWNADRELASTLADPRYMAAGYLLLQAIANPSDTDYQWAAWSLFDPAIRPPSNNGNDLSSLVTTAMNYQFTGAQDFYVYLPDNPDPGGPQVFISQTPEPNGLLLLGTGLLGFAMFLYYKRNNAVGSF